jgi:ankyrin repeat protein
MINKITNSSLVANCQSQAAETSVSISTPGGQPTMSSRESTAPSLVPTRKSLHSAAESGDITALLHAFMADRTAINARDPDTGQTPLQAALTGNHQRAATMLAALGARVHEIHPLSPAKNVSLHAASELGDPELLGKVLKSSAKDIDAHDPVAGLTPLAFALRGKHLDAARMLLEAGAKPEKANKDGSLPLVDIASLDMANAMQLLLAHGAPVDLKNSKGMTALREAARTGKEAAVKLLLAYGADADQVDDVDRTVLFDAVEWRKPSIVSMLLDQGLYIDHVDRSFRTVLHNVAQWGTVEMAQILLARGANQKHADCLPRLPIMIAAEYGNLAVLELLLPDAKQLLDTKDPWGNTALHLAAENGHDAAVKALIGSGADFRLAKQMAIRRSHWLPEDSISRRWPCCWMQSRT